MQSRIVITEDSVTREIDAAPGVTNTETRDIKEFLKEVGTRAPLETGILPPGVISIRQGGDHLQIVHQSQPGVNLINWGQYERDPSCQTYQLAQPYRIVVGDFLNGNLLGCRMFYSPEPITSLDQPLYHQNVPNLNCKGYRQTGVGWVCLYHTETWTHMGIAAKAVRMAERCSGVESYNDANMSNTDGPRFYAAHSKPAYTYQPATWEAKSQKEGFEWTLDKDLWIPILVKDQDTQDKHYPSGVPLTLRMAMEGNSNCYYGDVYWPKPINGLTRDLAAPSNKDLFEKVINTSFVNVKKVLKAQPAIKKVETSTGLKKASISHENQEEVKSFKVAKTVKVSVDPTTCVACGIALGGDLSGDCVIYVPASKQEQHFCDAHWPYMKVCVHCGWLFQSQDTMLTKEWSDICMPCAQECQCQQCGLVFNYHGGTKVCSECASVSAQNA